MHCLSMTEKKTKEERTAILLSSVWKPGGSLTKELWASSSSVESLNIKVRSSSRGVRRRRRQLHLKDIPFTFPLDGTCQSTMNSCQARKCWVLERVRSLSLGKE